MCFNDSSTINVNLKRKLHLGRCKGTVGLDEEEQKRINLNYIYVIVRYFKEVVVYLVHT